MITVVEFVRSHFVKNKQEKQKINILTYTNGVSDICKTRQIAVLESKYKLNHAHKLHIHIYPPETQQLFFVVYGRHDIQSYILNIKVAIYVSPTVD